jgi:predicted ArsR family transcriptional regulator
MNELQLLGPTKNRIVRLLQSKDWTAGGLASELNIQPSAARKHLEHLLELSIVREKYQTGSVGRPKKFYALTESGKELFPRNYDTILNILIGKISEHSGVEHARSLMTSIALDLARELSPPGTSPPNKNQVQEGLNKLGFEATIKSHDGQVTVISRNCPLLRTAVAYGELLCQGLHEELLRKTLEKNRVNRENWIVQGDSYCKHILDNSPTTNSTYPK